MKRLTLIFLLMIFVCGCSTQECVSQHTEQSICLTYIYSNSGSSIQMHPYYYPCKKTVCDEWVEEE